MNFRLFLFSIKRGKGSGTGTGDKNGCRVGNRKRERAQYVAIFFYFWLGVDGYNISMSSVIKSRSSKSKPSHESRSLLDLDGIGKAMLKDFDLLGIKTVIQLAKQDPHKLYNRLCRITGVRHDPCVLDTFECAVAQARDPKLPKEKRKWHWWSRQRLRLKQK